MRLSNVCAGKNANAVYRHPRVLHCFRCRNSVVCNTCLETVSRKEAAFRGDTVCKHDDDLLTITRFFTSLQQTLCLCHAGSYIGCSGRRFGQCVNFTCQRIFTGGVYFRPVLKSRCIAAKRNQSHLMVRGFSVIAARHFADKCIHCVFHGILTTLFIRVSIPAVEVFAHGAGLVQHQHNIQRHVDHSGGRGGLAGSVGLQRDGIGAVFREFHGFIQLNAALSRCPRCGGRHRQQGDRHDQREQHRQRLRCYVLFSFHLCFLLST